MSRLRRKPPSPPPALLPPRRYLWQPCMLMRLPRLRINDHGHPGPPHEFILGNYHNCVSAYTNTRSPPSTSTACTPGVTASVLHPRYPALHCIMSCTHSNFNFPATWFTRRAGPGNKTSRQSTPVYSASYVITNAPGPIPSTVLEPAAI